MKLAVNLPKCKFGQWRESKKGEHWRKTLFHGCLWPTTKQQAKEFIECNRANELLYRLDVIRVDLLLRQYGFKGDYKLTKSGQCARLINIQDFYNILKIKYNL